MHKIPWFGQHSLDGAANAFNATAMQLRAPNFSSLISGILIVALLGIYAWFTILQPGIFPAIGERDHFFIWGGAYRIALGQIPHRDYFSPLGPMIFIIPAYLYKFLHIDLPRAFILSQWLWQMMLLALTWLITCRWRVAPRCLAIILIASFAGSLTGLGVEFTWRSISWQDIFTGSVLGVYKPLATGLCSVFTFLLLQPAPVTRPGKITVAAILTILGWLIFFTKITYAAYILILLALVFAMLPPTRVMMGYMVALGMLSAPFIEWLSHGVLTAYLQDSWLSAQISQFSYIGKLWDFFTTWNFAILLVFLAALGWLAWQRPANLRLQKIFIICIILVPVVALIYYTDAANTHFSLLLAFIPLAWQYLAPAVGKPKKYLQILLIALLTGLIGLRANAHLQGLYGYYRYARNGENFSTASFEKYIGKSFLIGENNLTRQKWPVCLQLDLSLDACMQVLAQMPPQAASPNTIDASTYLLSGHYILNDAIQHGVPIDHLLVFDIGDPFSLLLGLTPPRGVPLWLHEHTINKACAPLGTTWLWDVHYILVPKYAMYGMIAWDLADLYQTTLQHDFVLIAQNKAFALYQKNQPDGLPQRYHCVR